MRIGFIIPDRVMRWDSVHQGIGYLAAYALKHLTVSECQVFRTYGTEQRELLNFLDQKWDVLGLSLTLPAVNETKEIVNISKSIGPAKIVLGGSQVTTLEEEVFDLIPSANFAVVGEGEITFYELLEALKNKGDFSKIRGLIYRDKEGRICKNKPRPFEPDLGHFPYPDRTLFKYDYDFHSIIGTRGCPFHCTFCNSSANWGHKYRVRNPKSIIDEIKYTLDLYGNSKYFAFNDDSFNIKKDWVIEVASLLEELHREFHIRWWIRGLRVGLVTEEMAEKFASSGLLGAACGVESANNEALKAMRKATTIEKIMRGVELLQSRGIPVNGQFIIGNHGDTLGTVKESIECAHKFKEATFGIAYPIPHTFLYDFVKKNNYFLPEPVPIKYKGRVIDWIRFDTPQFPVHERLEAVELAIKAKFYHNINYDEE